MDMTAALPFLFTPPPQLASASWPQHHRPITSLRAHPSGSDDLFPVVLVPGAGGNQLEIKLNDDYKPGSLLCRRCWWQTGYFRLWLDVPGILPPFTQCFAERIQLVYNPDNDRHTNAQGVESRVPFFGTTEGMKCLDPFFRKLSMYMGVLVKALEDKGYIDGKSLLGAPYDFRYAPGEHESPIATTFLEDLRNLVEKAYLSNGKQQVVLLSHSLGGLWTLYFLNKQTLSWRKKYVRHFIAVSAPWGGTVQEMRTYASGYTEGVPLIDPLVLRAEQRSSESNLWLLPAPAVFGDNKLVITRTRKYSAFDLPEFLEDIGYPEGAFLYKSRIPPLTDKLRAPGIPVTLVFSSGIKTPETLTYGENGFNEQPRVVNGDGDGTVNICSLSAVTDRWKATEGQTVKVIKFKGKTHTGILTDSESVDAIIGEIMNEDTLSKPLFVS